ncbi:MAG: glycosyltransferase family 2 protein [Microthrixaceae bacterium]
MSGAPQPSGPRVSVVVPCFNSLRFLPATLDTVRTQTFTDLEIVLVDDGGSDDLAGFVAGVADDRIRLIRQDNGGVSSARNRGLDEARGELVLCLDADDLLVPEALALLVGAYDATRDAAGMPLGMVYGWSDVVDEHGVSSGRVRSSDWEGDVWSRLVTRNVVALGAALVPAAVYRELGGFRVNRDRFAVDVEDWELWIRLAAGHRVALVSQIVLHVRRHGSNSTAGGATATLDAAYRHLMDQVFDDPALAAARPGVDLGALRAAATATAEMRLAWHSLNDDGAGDAAMGYLRSAARHDPEVRRTAEFWRLRAAAGAMQVLGSDGYERVRGLNSALRRRVRGLSGGSG